jgi:integrase
MLNSLPTPADGGGENPVLAQLAAMVAVQLQSGTMSMPMRPATTAAPLRLVDYVENQYLVEREIRESTENFYRRLVMRFSEWLGRDAMLADLTDDTVNRFLIIRSNKSRETTRSEKSGLLSLWNAAAYAGLVSMPPLRVRKLKRERRVVEGWSPEELSRLLAAAGNLRGRIQGKYIKRAAYWRAYVLTAYDTGLRLGDMLNLKTTDIKGPGSLAILQNKTGRIVDTGISMQAWEAIQATYPPHRGLIFGVYGRCSFLRGFRELVRTAGLCGTSKYLRRSSGSMVEFVAPGQGHKHLGHSDTGDTFNRHYNVRELTRREPILPPPIPEAVVRRPSHPS